MSLIEPPATNTDRSDDVTERNDEQPALSNDLLERILARGNMQLAWKQVRANRGAPGIHQMTLDDFPTRAKVH